MLSWTASQDCSRPVRVCDGCTPSFPAVSRAAVVCCGSTDGSSDAGDIVLTNSVQDWATRVRSRFRSSEGGGVNAVSCPSSERRRKGIESTKLHFTFSSRRRCCGSSSGSRGGGKCSSNSDTTDASHASACRCECESERIFPFLSPSLSLSHSRSRRRVCMCATSLVKEGKRERESMRSHM